MSNISKIARKAFHSSIQPRLTANYIVADHYKSMKRKGTSSGVVFNSWTLYDKIYLTKKKFIK